MNNELSQIDLYITVDDAELNRLLKESVAPINLDAVVHQALQEAGVTQPVMLTLMITDDATLHDMNKQYRQQDKPTDVLSFPQHEDLMVDALPAGPEGAPLMLGDIVVSLPRAEEQARAYGHSRARELGFLLAHGLLHLLGYDHESPDDAAVMEARQDAVLDSLGLRRDAAP